MPPELEALPQPFTRAQARRAGLTDRQLDRRLGTGELVAVRRGLLAVRRHLDRLEAARRHAVFVRAAMERLDVQTCASHASAAVLTGLPTPRHFSDHVTLTAQTGAGKTRYYPGTTLEVARLDGVERTRQAGLPITRPARTVADCLRHLPAPDAVAIGDAALRRQLIRTEHLAATLRACAGWPFAARAAARLPLLDPRRESPLESWSAVALHQAGLPLPEPQVEVYDEHDRFVARVDGCWSAWCVVGEADGWSKYDLVDHRPATGRPESLDEQRRLRFRAEKLREDRLRDVGLEVVRWSAADLLAPEALAARVLAARDRADPARFRGRLVSTADRWRAA